MRGLEGMIWKDVFQTFGGRKHGTNSHEIPVCDLSKDALRRAEAIQLNESVLFSLRSQSDVRLTVP